MSLNKEEYEGLLKEMTLPDVLRAFADIVEQARRVRHQRAKNWLLRIGAE